MAQGKGLRKRMSVGNITGREGTPSFVWGEIMGLTTADP